MSLVKHSELRDVYNAGFLDSLCTRYASLVKWAGEDAKQIVKNVASTIEPTDNPLQYKVHTSTERQLADLDREAGVSSSSKPNQEYGSMFLPGRAAQPTKATSSPTPTPPPKVDYPSPEEGWISVGTNYNHNALAARPYRGVEPMAQVRRDPFAPSIWEHRVDWDRMKNIAGYLEERDYSPEAYAYAGEHYNRAGVPPEYRATYIKPPPPPPPPPSAISRAWQNVKDVGKDFWNSVRSKSGT